MELRLDESEWRAAGTAGGPWPLDREDGGLGAWRCGGMLHNTYFVLARSVCSSFVAAFRELKKAAEWTQPDAARHCLEGLHDEAVRPLHVDPVALTVEW